MRLSKELLQNRYVNGEAQEKPGKWMEVRIKRSQLLTMVSELQMAMLEEACFPAHPTCQERHLRRC